MNELAYELLQRLLKKVLLHTMAAPKPFLIDYLLSTFGTDVDIVLIEDEEIECKPVKGVMINGLPVMFKMSDTGFIEDVTVGRLLAEK